jgi:serine/threonine protein kinase/Flp pilus assembly protein TadD
MFPTLEPPPRRGYHGTEVLEGKLREAVVLSESGERGSLNFFPGYASRQRISAMIGKTISHYKILEKLGEGGMGVVYKAEDTRLERPVALKFLSPSSLGTDEEKTRFIREAKAAAILDHSNICTVHEIDEAEGQTFISMAYIDGQTLSDRIQLGPLDVDEAINIALRIAEGLKHAHKKGIVHRDIKPANIMITRDDQAKIMDFGLAKLAGKSRLTGTATIMGTVAYMSPEQAHGDAIIDHRTDIWSLGVVLYAMLAGRIPFDAPTDAGLIHKIIYEEPEAISTFRDDVMPALEQAVGKMLEKDPQDRYEDMETLIADLETAKSGAHASVGRRASSIAVLPFVDMSPQKDQEYFCDGLAEELINALTQIEDLHVVARTSAFSFKGEKLDVREIGRRMNVETVLEGSVRKAGNRLRITGQLVNVADGYHLWSERYDREMEDIFAIQDEITLAIVDRLKPRLLRKRKARLLKRKTVDLDAYNLYLRGRFFWNKHTEEGFKKAIECFEQVIERDSDYAPAYAGLADSYAMLPFYSLSLPEETYPRARDAAMKALEIDDTLGEAHVSLAYTKMVYEWNWEDAEKGFKHAIELNPGYATAHHLYAYYLCFTNRFDEAIKQIRQAHKLDPLSLVISREVGLVSYFCRQYEEAIQANKKTIEMDPSYMYVHLLLGLAYLQYSMHDEAMAEFKKERRLSSAINPAMEGIMGMGYALMDKKDLAREALNNLLEWSKQLYIPPYLVASVYFGLGERDEGFEWLERAYEKRDQWICFLSVEPGFDNIRTDPRYIALLKKMGLDK